MSPPVRWHDKIPELARVIRFACSLNMPMQTLMGTAILEAIERHFGNDAYTREQKTIGSEKVMGLHKSQQKKRGYDHNPMLHKAVNAIYMMSPEKQQTLAIILLQLIDAIAQYIENQKAHSLSIEIESIRSLCKVFGAEGKPGLDRLLDEQIFLNNRQKIRDGRISQKMDDTKNS